MANSDPQALTAPITLLRTLLSQSAAFRTWTGTANESAAAAKVYRVEVHAPKDKRPFACVGVPEEVTGEIELRDSGEPFNQMVDVSVSFECNATEEQDLAAQAAGDEWPVYEPFASALNSIRQQVEAAGKNPVSGQYWSIVASSATMPPERAPIDKEGTLGRRLWAMLLFRLEVA